MNALEIRNLYKSYPGFQLENINLTLPMGCIMGFVGANGAGKSTTINLILDLIGRDKGEITVFGQDNRSLTAAMKEELGVVLDEACFPETLSAKDVNRIMKGSYQRWSEETFASYVDRFALPWNKANKEYSRGMKMKLSIAVALSHEARLLILDEATSGLDPVVRDELLDLFFDFIQEEDHAIFMSSHITSDLEKVCDYISFIHKGKLMFSEEKDLLLERLGVLKCSQGDLKALDPGAVLGKRSTAFGVEALVERRKVPSGLVVDRAALDDIMVFLSKGDSIK